MRQRAHGQRQRTSMRAEQNRAQRNEIRRKRENERIKEREGERESKTGNRASVTSGIRQWRIRRSVDIASRAISFSYLRKDQRTHWHPSYTAPLLQLNHQRIMLFLQRPRRASICGAQRGKHRDGQTDRVKRARSILPKRADESDHSPHRLSSRSCS